MAALVRLEMPSKTRDDCPSEARDDCPSEARDGSPSARECEFVDLDLQRTHIS